MKRPVTPLVHGAIDYGFLATMLLVPKWLKLSRNARLLFGVFGLTQGTLNAFTEQPLAIKPVLGYQMHGLIEKCGAPVYVLAPMLAGIAKEHRARAFWLGLGATLVLHFNLTNWAVRTKGRSIEHL